MHVKFIFIRYYEKMEINIFTFWRQAMLRNKTEINSLSLKTSSRYIFCSYYRTIDDTTYFCVLLTHYEYYVMSLGY